MGSGRTTHATVRRGRRPPSTRWCWRAKVPWNGGSGRLGGGRTLAGAETRQAGPSSSQRTDRPDQPWTDAAGPEACAKRWSLQERPKDRRRSRDEHRRRTSTPAKGCSRPAGAGAPTVRVATTVQSPARARRRSTDLSGPEKLASDARPAPAAADWAGSSDRNQRARRPRTAPRAEGAARKSGLRALAAAGTMSSRMAAEGGSQATSAGRSLGSVSDGSRSGRRPGAARRARPTRRAR
jgi:hypothetical protein